MKTRILIKFCYDGSKFHGFQRQNNVRNVQGELEQKLSEVFNEKIVIKGAGRTDAKVHAKNQYAHFDVDKKIILLKYKLNKLLKDIKIKSIKYVDNNFHARYSPKYKIYEYIISFNKNDDSNYYSKCYKNIDINKMIKGSKIFIGTHNFKNFVSGYRDNYETTIFDIKFKFINNRLHIKFKGIGFYRYMVRNLVGALTDLGKDKINEEVIKGMLDKPEIDKRLSTAKPEGLYLINIKY